MSVYRPSIAPCGLALSLLTCTNVWQDQVVARKHVIAQGRVICSLDIKRIVDCHQITCLCACVIDKETSWSMNHVIAVSCLSSLFSKRIRSFRIGRPVGIHGDVRTQARKTLSESVMTRPGRYTYVGEIVAYEPDGPRNPEPEEDLRNCLRDALFRSSKPISLTSLFWRPYYYATCQVSLPRRGWDVADTAVDDEIPTNFDAQPWNGDMMCTHCASLCGSHSSKRSYVFNHPLELHLDQKEVDTATTDLADPIPPRLVFQVLRVDGWERQFLEGYTFIDLPREPGSYNLNGSLWAPRGNLSERLSASFCGAFVPLAAPDLVASDEYQLPRNRSGLCVRSAGCLQIRLQVLRHASLERPRESQISSRSARLKRLELRRRDGRSGSLEGLRRRNLRAAAEPSPRLEG